MTDITIAAGGFPHYEGPPTGEIWIVANRPYTTPQGKGISANYVPESTFAIKVPFTVDGNKVLQVPQVVIDATEDSIDNPAATLGAYIMTSQGRPVSVLSTFKRFKVPASPILTGWGELAAHNAAVQIAAPATPSAPVATAIDSSRVDVLLAASAGAASYKLLRSDAGGAYNQIASNMPSGTYHDTFLILPVTAYSYKAIAHNLGGDSATSAASNTATTPPLSAPDVPSLSILASGADVRLTTGTTPRVTTYEIWRKQNAGSYALLTSVNVTSGVALEYHDVTVTDSNTFTYKVKALNIGGSSAFSNEVSATIVVTPLNPVGTANLAIWIDGENGSHSEGDSVASITDQSAAANNVTVNGNNAIYHKSGSVLNNHGYYANTLPNGRFTFTGITTARQVILVFHHRGLMDYLNDGNGLLSYAGGGANTNQTPGPGDHHRNVELFDRPDFPSGLSVSTQIANSSATVRINGGSALPLIPQMDSSWTAGGGWIHPTLKTLATGKPQGFIILSIKTAGNISIDTLMNNYGIPGTAFDGDLAAFGVWTATLSGADESGIVAFLKTRYGLTASPEQHLYIGDSLIYGAGPFGNNGIYNVPALAEADNRSNGLKASAINLGIGSAPLGDGVDIDLLNVWRTSWRQMRDPACAKQVVILWIGANDIGKIGLTGAQIYTNVRTFCTEARADGFKVLVISIAPSQLGGGGLYNLTNYASQRAAFNSAMDSDHSFADGWLNYSGNPQIGTDTAYNDHPENFADGIHLNATGNAILAPLVAAAIRAIS